VGVLDISTFNKIQIEKFFKCNLLILGKIYVNHTCVSDIFASAEITDVMAGGYNAFYDATYS
jgi:hypothetical protein